MDVATINYKSRRIGPAPIAVRFLHQVAGRVDNRRIDTGWENLNGPHPAFSKAVIQKRRWTGTAFDLELRSIILGQAENDDENSLSLGCRGATP